MVKNGRYGPYVSHNGINATLPSDKTPEAITLDEAIGLLDARAERTGGAPSRQRRRRARQRARERRARSPRVRPRPKAAATKSKKRAAAELAAKARAQRESTGEITARARLRW